MSLSLHAPSAKQSPFDAPRGQTAKNLTTDAIAPETAWAALAPLIAGQPTYREGRWIQGRFQYPRPATAPKITGSLPRRPAAVLVHGTDGRVATICLDLDTSRALRSVVDSDAARLGGLLSSCGLEYVEDHSPSGGRHLYVPLAERMDAAQVRELVEAMCLLAPSLDAGPHRNPTDGCIRVPGSAHKRGGHQMLTTPLPRAYDILRRRNPGPAVAQLHKALAPELRRVRQLQNRADRQSAAVSVAFPRGGSQLPLRTLARTGLYDTARYASQSEARIATLNHLAACGWTLPQIRLELTGQFRGLAALYGTPEKQARLLETEWAKAEAWIQKPADKKLGTKTTRINDTSHTEPTGGPATTASKASLHQLVNDLENVLYAVLDARLKKGRRSSHSLRLLFRAVLGYMRTMETDVLDVGCRTFATALGKHHATVARLLPQLESQSDGILTRINRARGRNADVYLIHLPDQYQQLARELTWRKGKIHSTRPVFRALSDCAALVYETIERARLSPTTADIVRTTGISRTAADAALSEMAALGMIHRDARTWKITASTNLTALAGRLGALDDVSAQITRHRKQRAAWHAWLDRHSAPVLAEHEIHDPDLDEYWFPPEDDLPLLRRLFQRA